MGIQSFKNIDRFHLDFFEEAYLSTCPYQFAKVSLDNLENVLNYLKAELE
ncbi:GntR family transcriptional regulator [Streptococcus pneumoniae]|nr:GntR family transcriptional regulator [Streptococcus pneumoniae]